MPAGGVYRAPQLIHFRFLENKHLAHRASHLLYPPLLGPGRPASLAAGLPVFAGHAKDRSSFGELRAIRGSAVCRLGLF